MESHQGSDLAHNQFPSGVLELCIGTQEECTPESLTNISGVVKQSFIIFAVATGKLTIYWALCLRCACAVQKRPPRSVGGWAGAGGGVQKGFN